MTFVPERHYINALLQYAASEKSGDFPEISKDTQIPTGSSSGKVPAILDYCRGMGLIELAGATRSAIKKPRLTAFGRVVLLEDPHLKEPITQWIAHFNLCDSLYGADVWYHVFFDGAQALGMQFTRANLEQYLGLIYGKHGSNIIGPLLRTYEDDAALSACCALYETEGIIHRRVAPVVDEFCNGYGAWILQLVSQHFPSARQVTITELDANAGWRTIPCWNIKDFHQVLDSLERKGFLEVDRHMDPWILRPNFSSDKVFTQMYDDLI